MERLQFDGETIFELGQKTLRGFCLAILIGLAAQGGNLTIEIPGQFFDARFDGGFHRMVPLVERFQLVASRASNCATRLSVCPACSFKRASSAATTASNTF